MSDVTPMTIMIPLGGLGSRFAKEGYSMRTKPFVRVLGKEMLLWLVEKLKIGPNDSLVIVYNPEFANIKVCMEIILKTKFGDRLTLVELAGPTRGAAETVLLGIQGMPPALQKRPIMLCDGDCFYTKDIVSMYRPVAAKGQNGIFFFNDTQPKPMYSYIKVDATGKISEVKEKVKISDNANSGCYSFANALTLSKYCTKIIDSAITQMSQDKVGEYYTSGVIAAMLEEDHHFQALELSKTDMHVLGTPAQVEQFCREWSDQPALRFVFDLDNTLSTSPKVPGDYRTCEPIPHTIAYLRQVKAQGHTVVIATARRMRTHGHNVGAVVADVGMLTMNWLAAHDIPYDEINFGKPWGHFYIDDLAVCPYQGDTPLSLAKQTGFYETTIKAIKSADGAGPGVVTSGKSPKKKAATVAKRQSMPPSYDEHQKHTLVATAAAAAKAEAKAAAEAAGEAVEAVPPGFWLGLAAGVVATSMSLAIAAAMQARKR